MYRSDAHPAAVGRRRPFAADAPLRAAALAVPLLAALLLAPGPPTCVPLPVDLLGDFDEACVRRLCPPETEPCAVGYLLPAGTPCDDEGRVCRAGRCVEPCVPSCEERACGPDGCRGTCGSCAAGEFCSAGDCVVDGAGPGPHMRVVSDVPGYARAIAVEGDVGLLAAGEMLFVLALGDDGVKRELGRTTLPGAAAQIAIDGGYAFVALEKEGLAVVDWRDHRAPTVVGRALEGQRTRNISVSGGTAFLAASEDGVFAVDVSEPSAPALVGTYADFYTYDVVASGPWAFVAGYDDQLQVLEVSDPRHMRWVGEARCGDHTLMGLALDGAYVYGLCDGVTVFDVHDPAGPVPLSHVADRWGWANSSQLAVADGVVYVAGNSHQSYVVVDARDVFAPEIVGRYCVGPAPGGYCDARDVATNGRTVYLAHGANGLLAFPAGVPEGEGRPEPLSTYRLGGDPHAIAAGDGWLVTVGEGTGVTVFDTSGRFEPGASLERPLPVGGYDTWFNGGLLVNSTLYVVGSSALRSLSLAEPTAVTELATLSLGSFYSHGDVPMAAGAGWLAVYRNPHPG